MKSLSKRSFLKALALVPFCGGLAKLLEPKPKLDLPKFFDEMYAIKKARGREHLFIGFGTPPHRTRHLLVFNENSKQWRALAIGESVNNPVSKW